MAFTMLVNEVTCADKVVIASILCTPAAPLAIVFQLMATGSYC